MGSKALKYSAVLIGTYLLVYNASKAGLLFDHGSKGGTAVIRAFQGR